MKTALLFLLFSLLLSQNVFGHGGIDHSKATVVVKPVDKDQQVIALISDSYKKNVEPVFRAKCFDCHSGETRYPGYYQIPGIKYFIDSHIAEAKSHLDFSKGFPFISHVKPEEDLKALKAAVENDKMPPWYYRPFHSGSSLSQDEKNQIVRWAMESLSQLSR